MRVSLPWLCAVGTLLACGTAPSEPDPAFAKGGPAPPPPPAAPAIAYLRDNGTRPDNVMVMNADGTNQAAVFTGLAFTGFTWSPDGHSVVFGGAVGGVYGVYAVDVTVVGGVPTGSNTRLLQAGFHWGDPQWSPAGDLIAVCGDLEPGRIGIAVFPAGGGPVVPVYSVPGYPTTKLEIQWPTWSPDQTRIAFMESDNATGLRTLKIIDLATSVVTDVASAPELFRWPDWSHDGTRIAYSMPTGRQESVYVVPAVAGGVPVLVGLGLAPSWMPLDTRLVVNVWGAQPSLGILPAAGGAVTVIAKNGSKADSR